MPLLQYIVHILNNPNIMSLGIGHAQNDAN